MDNGIQFEVALRSQPMTVRIYVDVLPAGSGRAPPNAVTGLAGQGAVGGAGGGGGDAGPCKVDLSIASTILHVKHALTQAFIKAVPTHPFSGCHPTELRLFHGGRVELKDDSTLLACGIREEVRQVVGGSGGGSGGDSDH